MNKKSLLIGLFILFVGSAFGYTILKSTNETSDLDQTPNYSSDEPEKSANIKTEPDDSSSTSTPGVYADYSDESLASATGETVLFFHAPWCSQCRAIEADIKQQGVPDGYTILKVDYDSNQALRQKYEVRLQTTFVKLDANNDAKSLFVAYEEPTFDAVKRDYL